MNLKECKKKIVRDKGYTDHETMYDVAKLYACEKVKEALTLAAERAEVIFENGYTNVETPHKQIVYDGNTFKPNRGLILSLETEFLTKINKEG